MEFIQFNGSGYEKEGFQLVGFDHVVKCFDLGDQETIFNLEIGQKYEVNDLSGYFYIKRVK